MRHWRDVSAQPGAARGVCGDWVDDFAGTLARVLRFLDLPDDPACHRFYETRQQGAHGQPGAEARRAGRGWADIRAGRACLIFDADVAFHTRCTPDAVALRLPEGQAGYAAMDAGIDRFAAALSGLAPGPDTVVGVMSMRWPDPRWAEAHPTPLP